MIGVRISCDILARNLVLASDRSIARCFSILLFLKSSTCWITINTRIKASPKSMGISSLFGLMVAIDISSMIPHTRKSEKPMAVYLYCLIYPFLISINRIITVMTINIASMISMYSNASINGSIPVKLSTVQNIAFITHRNSMTDMIFLNRPCCMELRYMQNPNGSIRQNI